MEKWYEGIGHLIVLWLIITAIMITGEVKCIVKAVNCNWDPIGKAEIIYTVSALTGVGIVVGWINIKDEDINNIFPVESIHN